MGTVYLLHFDQPYNHAKHYLGWSSNLRARMYFHRRNKGARLLAVLNDLGINYFLTRTWEGSRVTERSLKNGKNSPDLCPVCKLQRKNITKFFCGECDHNHFLRSMAGKKHYKYMEV